MQLTRYFPDGRGATLELEEVDGVLYPRYHDHLEKQLQRIRQLPVRDSDVILCTYPKAGTHWLWELLTMLANHTSELSHDLKRSAMLENSDLDLLISPADPSPSISPSPSPSPSPPRVLNTHLLPSALPEVTWRSQCRLVVCHRNPKDTVVSLYNMARQVQYQQMHSAFSGTFEGYASLFLQGTVPHGSWFSYVREWEEVRRRFLTTSQSSDRMYLTCYENMSRDPLGETRRLAEFLGTGTSARQCRLVAEACSFANMKEAPKHLRGTSQPLWKPNATGIFRKGKVGDWKQWMSDDLSQAFDQATLTHLSDLDLELTYEL